MHKRTIVGWSLSTGKQIFKKQTVKPENGKQYNTKLKTKKKEKQSDFTLQQIQLLNWCTKNSLQHRTVK